MLDFDRERRKELRARYPEFDRRQIDALIEILEHRHESGRRDAAFCGGLHWRDGEAHAPQ